MPRRLEPRDLFAVRWLSDVQLSADGRRTACVETRLDEAADGLRSRVLVLDTSDGRVLVETGDLTSADHHPRWSPDHRRLAYIGGRDGVARVHLVDADGLGTGAIVDGPTGVTGFDWAPDGDRLVVVVARPDPAAPSPDDVLVPVTVDRYKRDGHLVGHGRWVSTLAVLPLSGGPATSLTTGSVTDRAPRWSPDGRAIAFLSDRGREGLASAITDLWRVEAPAGRVGTGEVTPVRLTDGRGPIATFAWSPDGSRIAILGHEHGEATGYGWRLRLVPADGGAGPTAGSGLGSAVGGGAVRADLGATPAPIELTGDPTIALGLTVRSDDLRGMGDATLQWTTAADDERLWLRWADGGRGEFGWVALDGRWGTAIGGDRAVLSASVASAADAIAFVAADIDQPGELTIALRDGTGERPLTDRNAVWRDAVTLGTTRVVRAMGPGGLPVEAWLTLPPDDGTATGAARADGVARAAGAAGAPNMARADGAPRPPAPAVVSIHGGPHYPIGSRFSFETHRLAALGVAVLAPNPRGSLGYGDAVSRAVVGDWGGDDLADVLALVDAAVASGDIDPDRLAITGVSYGGYLTLWAVTQDQRFRLAIAENGIGDLVAAFGTGEDAGGSFAAELGGPPWGSREAWVERSPIHHADRIRTPVLLLHAELDQNCTIAQSEQMSAALRALGREVDFVRVPREGHLMDLVGSARFRMARMALIAAALRDRLGVDLADG